MSRYSDPAQDRRDRRTACVIDEGDQKGTRIMQTVHVVTCSA